MCLSYSGKNGASEAGWGFLWAVVFGLVAAGIAGYAVYKYRIRVRYRQPVMLLCSLPSDSSLAHAHAGLASDSVPAFARVCRGTWTRRSAPSWPSTCLWTAKEMSRATRTILRCEEDACRLDERRRRLGLASLYNTPELDVHIRNNLVFSTQSP